MNNTATLMILSEEITIDINVLQNSLANGPFCLRKSIFNPFLTNGVT